MIALCAGCAIGTGFTEAIQVDLGYAATIALLMLLELLWGALYAWAVVTIRKKRPVGILPALLVMSPVGVGVALLIAGPLLGLTATLVALGALAIAAAPVALIVGRDLLDLIADPNRIDL